MRKILFLSILSIVVIAGCTQQGPTGKFLANQNLSIGCTADWNCTVWSDCFRTGSDIGLQNRTCLDNNNCNDFTNKPQESRICGLPKIALKDPEKMALELPDLPKNKNWTIAETNIRSREEASNVERELGFKNGYYVHYSSQYKENDSFEFTDVYNYISIYSIVNSAINMTFSFDTAKENYKVGSLYEKTNKRISSISELPDPHIGDFSIAYNITVVSDGTNLKENLYTICFTKMDVSDVVTIEGTNISYDFIRDLAKKTEEKIA